MAPSEMQDIMQYFHGKYNYYQWMSNTFLFVPDWKSVEAYKTMADYIDNTIKDNTDLCKSIHQIITYHSKLKTDEEKNSYLDELKRNYTYMFCFGQFIPMTESAYISASKLNNEADIDNILAMYKQCDYTPNTGMSNEPADHIGVMLGFLSAVNYRCMLLAEKNNLDEIVKGMNIQLTFMEKHLINWIKPFCKKVLSRREIFEYYHPLIIILEKFIFDDMDSIKEIFKQL